MRHNVDLSSSVREASRDLQPSPLAHQQRITVRYEYPVYFTHHLFSSENPHFAAALLRREPDRRHRLCVVLERAVAAAWPDLAAELETHIERRSQSLELLTPPVVIEGGEPVKNDPAVIADLQGRFDRCGMDRQSFVIAIGGGALQDAVGYAAATTHRGLRMVRVPTTVLSQNDSGVGVKNGINAFGKKNYLGTFAPPFAVLNDSRFLSSLAHRDAIAGLAEAVKVALIRDGAFFGWLIEHASALSRADAQVLRQSIRTCALLHLDHIATSGDPFEFGSARPLDFGHWAAHKLETLTDHRLRHGEAVAIGVAIDTVYSVKAGLLAAASLPPVLDLLARLGLPLWDDALTLQRSDGSAVILDGLAEFREHLGGELTVTLLAGIGRGLQVGEISAGLVLESIEWLRARAVGTV